MAGGLLASFPFGAPLATSGSGGAGSAGTNGIPLSSQTEVWYSATLGADSNLGATVGSPIKTITRLGRMMFGFGNSGSAILYVDAPLSDAESQLFYQFTANDSRQWQVINGALPVTPSLWFDMRDLNGNGNGNAGFVDGQAYSTSIVNKGSLGVGLNAVVQAGTYIYRKVAAAGKLRGSPAIEFGGGCYLKTLNGATVGPSTWVAIFMISDSTLQNRLWDGSNNTCGVEYQAGSPPNLIIAAPGGVGFPSPFNNVTVGQYNYFAVSMNVNGNAGPVLDLNGLVSGTPGSAGSNFAVGATIGAWNDGSNPLKGQLVSLMLIDGPIPSADPTLFRQWIQYNYGATFPQ